MSLLKRATENTEDTEWTRENQELIALGLIKEVRQRLDRETKFEPVRVSDGQSISETIIEERR